MVRTARAAGAGQDMLESPVFRSLVRRRWVVSIVLTLVLFAVYGTYIGLVAYGRGFLARGFLSPASGATVGVAMAVGVIGLSWMITVLYVLWANGPYDHALQQLRMQHRRGG